MDTKKIVLLAALGLGLYFLIKNKKPIESKPEPKPETPEPVNPAIAICNEKFARTRWASQEARDAAYAKCLKGMGEYGGYDDIPTNPPVTSGEEVVLGGIKGDLNNMGEVIYTPNLPSRMTTSSSTPTKQPPLFVDVNSLV